MVNGMKSQKEKKLTPKERLFVAEYLVDLNATQAAIRAGYSRKTANEQGARMLAKVSIQEALAAAQNSIEKREEKALMSAYEVEKLLDEIMMANPKDYFDEKGHLKAIHELTDEQARCVKELGMLETRIGVHRTIKSFDKLQAIDKKMKRLGMFKDVVEVEDPYVALLRMIQEEEKNDSG